MNNREAMQEEFETCERYAGRDFAKTNGVYADDGVQHEFGHFLEGYQAALASQAQQGHDIYGWHVKISQEMSKLLGLNEKPLFVFDWNDADKWKHNMNCEVIPVYTLPPAPEGDK